MTEHKPLKAKEIVDRLAPGRVEISRDGRLVAFTVAPVGYKGKHPTGSIWLSRDGQPARQFTSDSGLDTNPVFSPDGTKLAFLSTRNDPETTEILIMSVDGGEASVLGKTSGSLGNLQFSPDGTELSVLRRQSETKKRKQKDKKLDDAIVVGAEPRYNRLRIVDLETGKHRQIDFGKCEIHDYAWSPDGKQIAYVTAEEIGEDAPLIGGDLWIVDRDGQNPRHIAALDQTPTGIAFVNGIDGPMLLVHKNGFREHPATSVYLVDLTSGALTNLLEEFPGNVDAILPLDGITGSLAVDMVEGVHTELYRFDIATRALTSLLPGSLSKNGAFTSPPAVTPTGDIVAVNWSDSDVPEEIYLVRHKNEPVKLTSFGEKFNSRLRRSEVVSWTSDDLEIFGLLTLPERNDDKPLPLVVQIHGGPSWQRLDHCFLDWHDWTQYLVSRGFAVLTPNPRGSTGRGSEFQRRLIDDVGGGEMRDVIAGAQAMVDRGIADPERLGVGGWSWGGYLTAYTITRTQMFKAAVMGAGLSNMISDHGTDDIPSANLYYYPGQPYHHLDTYWESSAIKYVTNCVTPTLIVHGEADDRVHITQGAEMYRALKVLDIPVEFVRYPREPHGFKERKHQIDLLKRIGKWYERWLMLDDEKSGAVQ